MGGGVGRAVGGKSGVWASASARGGGEGGGEPDEDNSGAFEGRNGHGGAPG
jgi:hypothetical protein